MYYINKFKLILISLISVPIFNYYTPHFYKARLFQGEPRFEKPLLFTVDAILSGGQTAHAYNNNGQKVCLLEHLGDHSLKISNKDSELIKNNKNNIAYIKARGEFSCFEAIFNVYCNLVSGFFLQAYIPVRKLALDDIMLLESPNPGDFNEFNKFEFWNTISSSLPGFLAEHEIFLKKVKHSDISDFSTLLGWSKNYQDTVILDYIDLQLTTGIVWPTGKKRDLSSPFEVTSGYGHLGVPLVIDMSLGLFDWVTCGAYGQTIIFKDKIKPMRIKDSLDNLGVFKLDIQNIKMHKTNVFSTGLYIKADHVVGGLSLLLGYAYDQKNRDYIIYSDNNLFNYNIANTDKELDGWNMHTFQFLLDYDFNTLNQKIGPRVGLFYNNIISGKNIFNTSVFGGNLGVDISYTF